MARIIPEIDVGRDPHGEELFYSWLRALPRKYIVFHSVHMLSLSRGAVRKGEAEFLVIDRERGMLVIRTVAGEAKKAPRKNMWVSVSPGKDERVISDPFKRAEQDLEVLAAKCREKEVFGAKRKSLPVTCGYAVAFPDGAAPREGLPPDVLPGMVLDREDGSALAERIDALFELWENRRRKTRAISDAELNLLFERVLLTRYEVTRPLYLRLAEEKGQLVRLTRVQSRILADTIPTLKRALFKGYAGTGKTQLLMEKARRLAAEGSRVLVVCYNQPLADALRLWASVNPDPIKVGHFHGLCEEYARAAGLPYEEPPEESPRQEFFDSEAPVLLARSLASVAERFDCILVDEGQDFRREWFDVLLKLLDPEGRDVFYIFYDEQQNIYGKPLEFPFEAEPFVLPTNVRSTRSICGVTSGIGSVKIRCAGGAVAGQSVRYHSYRSPGEQVAIIEEIVRSLLRKQLPPERVRIISSHKRSRSCLAGVEQVAGVPVVEYGPPGKPGTIGFSSLHRAKGLESDVVIFCDVDGGEPYCSRANQYVAVSRARLVLHVVHRADWNPPKRPV